jgi:6-phosphogluconate dehydrogenase
MKKQVIIIMGVSGSGKTTIGQQLSARLRVPFSDADDFHPAANVEKMSAGIPLDDDDRTPWLQILAENLKKWEIDSGAILACSALKEKYRAQLIQNCPQIQWVYLDGSFDLIYSRMKDRAGHYMPAALLTSQFDALEIPSYGMHVDISGHPDSIINTIMSQLNHMQLSKFGVIGLGVMGRSISLNFAEKGVPLSVYNRTEGGEHKLIDSFRSMKSDQMTVQEFGDLEPFIQSIERPRKILLMVQAGKVTDEVIGKLTPILDEGDIIIDGGNSHYEDTKRRFEALQNHQIGFVGCGISGGEEGARNGPAIMPGGDKTQYELIAPYLNKVAAKDKEGTSCCAYIGPNGAGHFVKMVHNGIEYAEMQLLAELYHLLSGQMSNVEIAELFSDWNKGDLASYLLEITIDILQKKEGDEYLLDLILDQAGNKGTGGWSSKAALDLGAVNSMMAAAVFARYQSSSKRDKLHLSGKINHQSELNKKINLEALENAYRFARLMNHHQGFDLLRIASDEYAWDLSLVDVSRVWTNGCIIRSALMENCVTWFRESDQLILIEEVFEDLRKFENVMPVILQSGMHRRVPMPVFTAAWNDWVSRTSEKLPANLIQAQRDYFGAHTYKRINDPEGKSLHTNWK